MLVRNSSYHYGQIARVLHWTSVCLLVAAVYSSSLFSGLDDGTTRKLLVADHASYGIVLLCVMLVRFFWRQTNANPIQSYNTHAVQKRLAISVHWFIYAVVVFQAFIGVLQVLVAGEAVSFFGVELFTPLSFQNLELGQRLNDVHLAIANVIYWVLGVHITAAVYHQIFGVLDPRDQLSN